MSLSLSLSFCLFVDCTRMLPRQRTKSITTLTMDQSAKDSAHSHCLESHLAGLERPPTLSTSWRQQWQRQDAWSKIWPLQEERQRISHTSQWRQATSGDGSVWQLLAALGNDLPQGWAKWEVKMHSWQLAGGRLGDVRRRGQEERGRQLGWKQWRGETLSAGDDSGELEPQNTRIQARHNKKMQNYNCGNSKLSCTFHEILVIQVSKQEIMWKCKITLNLVVHFNKDFPKLKKKLFVG